MPTLIFVRAATVSPCREGNRLNNWTPPLGGLTVLRLRSPPLPSVVLQSDADWPMEEGGGARGTIYIGGRTSSSFAWGSLGWHPFVTLLAAASVRSVPSEAQYCPRLSSPNSKLGFDSSSQKERDFLHYKIFSLRTLLMSCQLFLTGGLSPASCSLIKTTILEQDWAVYKMHFRRSLLILKRVPPLHLIVLSLQVLPSCLYRTVLWGAQGWGAGRVFSLPASRARLRHWSADSC